MRKNPYVLLKERVRAWASSVLYPRRKHLFLFKKEILASCTLEATYQRVTAAQTLGWRVEVKATEEGLTFEYVEQPSTTPWEIS